MATQYNMHEAKTQFSKLVDRALAGEDIVVAKAGKPAVRLVPVPDDAKERRRNGFGILRGLMPPIPDSFFFDPLPEEELRLWEGR